MTSMHVVNAAGLYIFGGFTDQIELIPKLLAAVTGGDQTLDDIYETGMRIATMRHAFNLREAHNALRRNVPGRMIGRPPLEQGRLKGITIDYETMREEFLHLVGWDVHTTIPSEESLRRLRMQFLLEDMQSLQLPTG